MPPVPIDYDAIEWERLLLGKQIRSVRYMRGGMQGFGLFSLLRYAVPAILENPVAQHVLKQGADFVGDVFQGTPIKEALRKTGRATLKKLRESKQRGGERSKAEIVGVIQQSPKRARTNFYHNG